LRRHELMCRAAVLVLAAGCGSRVCRTEHVSTAPATASTARRESTAPRPLLREELLAHVDPFIGTGGDGHTFPGATAPFGMIQLSPDTDFVHFAKSYPWAAGYRHDDDSIRGFSHTHFSGTGHSDLGDVSLMPTSGPLELDAGPREDPDKGYRSRFRHETEQASPGYYAVTLDDSRIRVELTASERVGVHRYTFAEATVGHVLLDLVSSIYDYDGKVQWAELRVASPTLITGSRRTRGWAPNRELHFAIEFSRPFSAHGLVDEETGATYRGFAPPQRGEPVREHLEGTKLKAHFDFPVEKNDTLLVAVAVSNVDVDGALANLRTLPAGWTFDGVRADTVRGFREALGAIEVDASPEVSTMFYTALYHTLMAPNLASDADGRFRGPDHHVHRAEGFDYYSTFSLWDTFRALHPLHTLIQRERSGAFVRSLLASHEHSPYGLLPVWSYHGLETWCMIGYHAVSVIADAHAAAIPGFSAEKALEAMVESASYAPYEGLRDYMALGYVPIDREPEGASKTLEYAYDDWAIARMADALGKSDIAARFYARAASYRNVFDKKTGYMRAKKADGSFREPFDPAAASYKDADFTEGSALQYSWFVPHDPAGLITLLGGDEVFVSRLDALFDAGEAGASYADVEDITGLIGHYAHGNEPDHHAPYLYNYAGAPWKTQHRVRQIMSTMYAPKPEGIAGNDDCGQMSAWYVFSALGFYPVAPGNGELVLGVPFVERATLRLETGKTFTIATKKSSPAAMHVTGVRLDGKPLERSFIYRDEILAGGELLFELGEEPSSSWGVAPSARPSSMTRAGRD
jgi:predicted alpha-1,2-mannosidase